MLPKQVVPERGSRKVINGTEFFTKHVFTTESGNVLETIDGTFILPNGEPANDKAILELLPGQHSARALAWWKKNFGENGKGKLSETKNQSTGPTNQDLLEVIADLNRQVAVLTARMNTNTDNSARSLAGTRVEEAGSSPPEKGKGSAKGRGKTGPDGKGVASVAGADALKGLDQDGPET